MDQDSSPSKKRELLATLAVLIVIVVIVTGVIISSRKKPADELASTTALPVTTNDIPATSPDASQVSDEQPSQSNDTATTNTPAHQTTTETAPAPVTTPSTTYRNGSFSATGSYSSPGGNQTITIEVTIKDDVVVASSAQSGATDEESDEFQDKFISGYKQHVVGKKVDSVSLSRVSGSSLTSQGFNNALSKIRTQART